MAKRKCNTDCLQAKNIIPLKKKEMEACKTFFLNFKISRYVLELRI